jgi:hypothetical protein
MQAEAPAAHLPRQTMKSSTDRECRRNAMPRTTNMSAAPPPTGQQGHAVYCWKSSTFLMSLKYTSAIQGPASRAARTETDSSRSASRRLLKTAARPTRSRGPLSNMFFGKYDKGRLRPTPEGTFEDFAERDESVSVSRLMSSLRRVPRLDPRFRGDDTCWLGRSQCGNCFESSPKLDIGAVEIWKCLA